MPEWIHEDDAQDMMWDLMEERTYWRSCAREFAKACEIDGFNGVKSADLKRLTGAMEMYNRLVEDYPHE